MAKKNIAHISTFYVLTKLFYGKSIFFMFFYVLTKLFNEKSVCFVSFVKGQNSVLKKIFTRHLFIFLTLYINNVTFP
jgi:hypothetical protein